MTIKIDKNIKLPAHGNSKYPFGDMEVGDSFYTDGSRQTVAGLASKYGVRNGMKFSTRAEGDGLRVWRVS